MLLTCRGRGTEEVHGQILSPSTETALPADTWAMHDVVTLDMLSLDECMEIICHAGEGRYQTQMARRVLVALTLRSKGWLMVMARNGLGVKSSLLEWGGLGVRLEPVCLL
jgi:hypothetical protein